MEGASPTVSNPAESKEFSLRIRYSAIIAIVAVTLPVVGNWIVGGAVYDLAKAATSRVLATTHEEQAGLSVDEMIGQLKEGAEPLLNIPDDSSSPKFVPDAPREPRLWWLSRHS